MIELTKEHASVIHTMAGIAAKGMNNVQEHIYIERKNGTLTLQAANAQHTLKAVFQASGDNETYLVHAKKLSDILKAMGNSITLAEKKNTTSLQGEIKNGKSKYAIGLLDPSLFVHVKPQAHIGTFNLDAKDFKRVANMIGHALNDQDPRTFCHGMYLSLQNNTLTCSATDGHRIAVYDLTVVSNDTLAFVLPKKSMTDVQRMAEGIVSFTLTKNYVSFEWDNITYTSNLIDAKYPDFKRVLPQKELPFIEIPREELEAALQRIMVVIDKFPGAKASFNNNTVTLTAQKDNDVAEVELDIVYTETAKDVGFNVFYMKDIIQNLSSNIIRWAWADRNAIYITNPDDPAFKCLVMPMNV